jgi:glycosyltransferase involved in cell wall biosynthesis
MCSRAGIDYEIIVGNDGSTTNMQNLKNLSQTLENFRFLDFKNNRGRSIIRNTLAKEAKFEKLLFIDSDMKVYKTDFIQLYIKENSPIVAGGIKVLEDKNPTYILHKKCFYYLSFYAFQ